MDVRLASMTYSFLKYAAITASLIFVIHTYWKDKTSKEEKEKSIDE